jgi:hypothetical protein
MNEKPIDIKCQFVAPVRFIKLRCFTRIYVQRSFKLRAPVHGQNVCVRRTVLVDNNHWPSVLQAGRILPLKVNFGESYGVPQQGTKQEGVSQPQPSSNCKCIRNECFTS